MADDNAARDVANTTDQVAPNTNDFPVANERDPAMAVKMKPAAPTATCSTSFHRGPEEDDYEGGEAAQRQRINGAYDHDQSNKNLDAPSKNKRTAAAAHCDNDRHETTTARAGLSQHQQEKQDLHNKKSA